MDLVLDVSERDHLAVLALRGEVDVSTAPKLRQQLVELATEGRPWVVVDLSEVAFLDSTGLGVLVSGLRRFRLLGGDLILAAAQPRILRVLEITRLDRAFDLFASVDAAVTAGIGR
jgi:anti-sigma B factor antagonist